MRKMALALLVASCCLYVGYAHAAERFVDKNSPFPAPPYLTWDSASHSIQAAVSLSGDGDTVWVNGNSGTMIYTGYNEDPGHDTNVVVVISNVAVIGLSNPIIDGQGETRGVYMKSGSLDGFTIRNGRAQYGGGVYSSGGHIFNCQIISNCARLTGGGVHNGNLLYDGGRITNCTFYGNVSSNDGGGAYSYRGRIEHCIFSNNTAVAVGDIAEGGGLYIWGGSAYACQFYRNTALAESGTLGAHGGGIWILAADVSNVTVMGNSVDSWGGPNRGGGVYLDIGLLVNAVIASNYLTGASFGACGLYINNGTARSCLIERNHGNGYGIYLNGGEIDNFTIVRAPQWGLGVVDGTIVNSIIWSNAFNYTNLSASGITYSYCCLDPAISGDADGGHNISDHPQFQSYLNSNFRLQVGSPCVDQGLNAGWMTGARDVDGNFRIWITNVDMGAYECGFAITNYVTTNGAAVWPYLTWDNAATNIQDAVDAQQAGGLTLVREGYYMYGGRPAVGQSVTNRVLIDKAVTVRATGAILDTIIIGNSDPGPNAARCVQVGAGAMLSGFGLVQGATGTNGWGLDSFGGGAIIGLYGTISNCEIAANQSYYEGGGVYCMANGTLASSYVHDNYSYDGGGVWVNAGGMVTNSQVEGNMASWLGGGVYLSEGGSVIACSVSRNNAPYGGGLYFASGGLADRCHVFDNDASIGGGGAGFINAGMLRNSVVDYNTAANGGGIMFQSGGSAVNCTIVTNLAIGEDPVADGVWFNNGGSCTNSIVHGNHDANWVVTLAGSMEYCCTTPNFGSGTGNLYIDPDFVNFAAGNFQLDGLSLCVDAGVYSAWMDNALDLAEKDRLFGSVDMGAYEYYPHGSEGDTDFDGQTDAEELIAGTDPGNSNSFFHVERLSRASAGWMVMQWSGAVQRSYSVLSTTNLLGPQVWQTTSFANQPGTGGMMSCTNTMPNRSFFRLIVIESP